MRKVMSGDIAAFEQLYNLTYKPVFSFLLSLTANQEDAKDLLQETFLRVLGSAHLYKEQGNLMAWIMKIGRNLFLMEQRKRREIPVSEEELRTEQLNFDAISDRETRILMEQLFRVLTEDEREIVVLHAIAGFRHKEIAEMMDIPLGTILSKYNRAMKKLKNTAGEM